MTDTLNGSVVSRTILTAIILTGLSGAAWGQTCPQHPSNPQLCGDDLLPPTLPINPLMNWSIAPNLSTFSPVCGFSLQTSTGTISLDLCKGTVDLGGAKLDDAARGFWDAVRKIAGMEALRNPGLTSPPPPGTWHLLQKQQDGGIAGILSGLTKDECEFAKNRIEGNPATPQEQADADLARKQQEDAWIKWEDTHQCKESDWRVTSQRSTQDDDGTCWGGIEFGGMTITGPFSPHDVTAAECFQ